MEALDIAKKNPASHVVFLGIGFETTTPSSAVAISEAHRLGMKNFSILSMHKLMPPAMAALIEQGVRIDGYIGPGHVTSVAGADMYLPLTEKFDVSVVISGFEPVDLLQSIFMLVNMAEENRHGVEIQYKRAVTGSGNLKARHIVNEVFEPCDDEWRGLGLIPGSGLSVRKKYDRFNSIRIFNPEVANVPEPPGCICGEMLRGVKKPVDCKLFGKLCTPANPVGSCMVSGEGACQAYYNYF
jgi:hydrogenase expression/formation protein HypD